MVFKKVHETLDETFSEENLFHFFIDFSRSVLLGHYPTSSQTPIQIAISIPYPNYEVILGVENSNRDLIRGLI